MGVQEDATALRKLIENVVDQKIGKDPQYNALFSKQDNANKKTLDSLVNNMNRGQVEFILDYVDTGDWTIH